MALPEIKIILTAVGDKAIATIGEVDKRLDRLAGTTESAQSKLMRIGQRTQDLGRRMSYLSAAVVAGAGGLFALASSSASAADGIAKAARSAGVSGQYFQEMAYAVGQVTNLSRDDLRVSMTILTRKIGEAADGSKSATAALAHLGFTQGEIASGAVTTEQAFDAYIRKLGGITDPALAAAISTDLFGKAGAKMGTQLAGAGGEISSLRSQANSLGIVLSDKALAAGEKFGDQMDTLQQSLKAVALKIGAELLPVLTETLLPALQDKVIPALTAVGEKVGEWVQWFGDLPAPVQEAALSIGAALGAAGPILLGVGLVTKAFSALMLPTSPLGLFIAAAVLAATAWATWGDDIKAAIGGAIEYISQKFQDFMDMIQRVIDKAVKLKDALKEALGLDQFGAGGGNTSVGDRRQGGLAPAGDTTIAGGRGKQMGVQIGDGLIDGVDASIAAREEELRAIVDRVPAIARDQLGIQSPSRVFAEIGGFIGAGLADGIGASSGIVAASVSRLTGVATMSAQDATKSFLASMGTLFEGSKAISAGIAIANTWLAATEVLKDPSFVGRPWARFAAVAATVASGANAVKNIKGARPGGSVGGAGGGGGGAAPAAAAPRPAEVTLNLQGPGAEMFRGFIGPLADALRKEFGDSGYVLGVRQ